MFSTSLTLLTPCPHTLSPLLSLPLSHLSTSKPDSLRSVRFSRRICRAIQGYGPLSTKLPALVRSECASKELGGMDLIRGARDHRRRSDGVLASWRGSAAMMMAVGDVQEVTRAQGEGL